MDFTRCYSNILTDVIASHSVPPWAQIVQEASEDAGSKAVIASDGRSNRMEARRAIAEILDDER